MVLILPRNICVSVNYLPLLATAPVTLQNDAHTVECSVIEKFYQSQVQSESDRPTRGGMLKWEAGKTSPKVTLQKIRKYIKEKRGCGTME